MFHMFHVGIDVLLPMRGPYDPLIPIPKFSTMPTTPKVEVIAENSLVFAC